MEIQSNDIKDLLYSRKTKDDKFSVVQGGTSGELLQFWPEHHVM